MSNDNDKDGNSSGDQIVEVTLTIWDGAVMIGEQSAATPENSETFELDPRDKASREKEEPTESLILDETQPDRTVKIGAGLAEQVKRDISNLLKEYKEIFAWSHEDMPGISRNVISHNLAVNDKSKPVVQKRRSFNLERSAAIKEEVSKLLATGSI